MQKYLSLTGLVYLPFIVLASKKWFDKLSAEDKATVRAAAVEAGAFERQQREPAVALLQTLKGKGMRVNERRPRRRSGCARRRSRSMRSSARPSAPTR